LSWKGSRAHSGMSAPYAPAVKKFVVPRRSRERQASILKKGHALDPLIGRKSQRYGRGGTSEKDKKIGAYGEYGYVKWPHDQREQQK